MRIRDVLSRIPPRDPANKWSNVSFGDIAELVGVGYQTLNEENDEVWDARTYEHYIMKRMCTDTIVGIWFIMLDGEPVILASQTARKNDAVYEFLSREAYDKVRAVVLSLITPEEEHIPIVNLDEELSSEDGYRLDFESYIVHPTGTIDGEPVDIIHYHRDWPNNSDNWLAFHDPAGGKREYLPDVGRDRTDMDGYVNRTVTVRFKDGTIKHVPAVSVLFPFDLLPEANS